MTLSMSYTNLALTLAMSLHSRLGNDSLLNSLTEDLTQLIMVKYYETTVKGSQFSRIANLYKNVSVTSPEDKRTVYQLKIQLGNTEPKAGEAELEHIENLLSSIEKHVANRVYYQNLSLQQFMHNLREQEQAEEDDWQEAQYEARHAMERQRLELW